MPRPQRSPVLAVGVLSWLAAVAVAWGVSAGTIPVNRWLETGAEPARAKQSPARAPARALDTPRIVAVEPKPAPTAEPMRPAEPTPSSPEPDPTPAWAPSPALTAEPAPKLVARAAPEHAPAPAPALQQPTPAPAPPPAPAPAPVPPPAGPGSSDGLSCEAAAAAANDEIRIGGPRGPADLHAEDYARVLNRGGYLGACGVPEGTRVDVCAAVQNGRALGVTVRMSPRAPGSERCVARRVRSLAFPAHPRLDVARTRFE